MKGAQPGFVTKAMSSARPVINCALVGWQSREHVDECVATPLSRMLGGVTRAIPFWGGPLVGGSADHIRHRATLSGPGPQPFSSQGVASKARLPKEAKIGARHSGSSHRDGGEEESCRPEGRWRGNASAEEAGAEGESSSECATIPCDRGHRPIQRRQSQPWRDRVLPLLRGVEQRKTVADVAKGGSRRLVVPSL